MYNRKMSLPQIPDQAHYRPRVFKISDETFKILTYADKKNFDPTVGLENIVKMYLALNGPVDFDRLDLAKAKHKAKELELD